MESLHQRAMQPGTSRAIWRSDTGILQGIHYVYTLTAQRLTMVRSYREPSAYRTSPYALRLYENETTV